MNKKNLLFLLIFLPLLASAQTSRTIHVATAGTLSTLISEEEKYQIEDLTLTGELNGSDIRYIRDLSGINYTIDNNCLTFCDYHDVSTSGKLTVLDITNTNIVSGGDIYYAYTYNHTDDIHYLYWTSNNSITDHMFYGCKLEVIKLPDSVTSIDNSAFYGCSGLSITLPNSMKSIGNSAFFGFGGLKSVTIPNSVTRIGEYAFENCSNLEAVTIGSGVSFIDVNAFKGCNSLKAVHITDLSSWCKIHFEYDGPNQCSNPLQIANHLYLNGVEIKDLAIPNDVTSIGWFAFYGWNGLKSVTIPNNVTSIDWGAFWGCSGLTSITIPNSVIEIGGSAFYGCSGLTTIVSEIENPFVISDNVFECSDKDIYATATLVVPPGIKSVYQNTAGWKKFKNIVEVGGVGYEFEANGVRYLIGENNTVSVISKTEKYTGAISIPNQVSFNGNNYTVTAIAQSAFEGCTGMTAVTIPSSVTTIGDAAFYYCTGLTTVDIPNGVRTIGEGAFSKCGGLTSVTIPGSVTSIGKNAFFQCYGLTQISSGIENPFAIDEGVFPTSVYNNASLLVPSGRKSAYQNTAGWKRFQNIVEAGVVDKEFEVNGIRYLIGENNTVSVISKTEKYTGTVSIPSKVYYDGNNYTVTAIAYSAFEGCTGLTSVTIPSSVTTIGGAAFYMCTGLITVDIPNGVKTIGEGAFSKCGGLTSVTIPGSVTSIDKNAFFQCYGLTQITSGIENPFAIEDGVFPTSVYNNASLLVPSGKRSAYQNTAGWKRFQNIIEPTDKDDVSFTIDAIAYEGSRSGKTVVVKSVDTSKTWMEIPASVSYDGRTYQVTGIDNDVFKGSSMAALIWNVEAMLPNNAFSNASIGSNFLLYVKSSSYAPSSVKNVIVDGTAQTIVLSDDGGQFYCPQAFTANSISYTHNYTMETGGNGKGWESLALPFFVQKISHNTRGEIVPFALYSSGSSQKPFWLAKFSGNEFKRTSAIEANEPYIIAMPNNKNYRNDYNLAGEVTFSAENAAVPKTPTFDGAFVPAFTPVTKSSSVKALNNASYSGGYDPGSCFISNLRDVHPFEAYMTGNSSRGIIEINYDNGTTDMFDILFSTDDAQELTIYTLGGLQVARATQRNFDAVWQQLPKGIYLVNGNKRIR